MIKSPVIYISKYRGYQCWPCRRLDLDKSESLGSSERERSGEGTEPEGKRDEGKRAEKEMFVGVAVAAPLVKSHSNAHEPVSLPAEHMFLWFHPMLPSLLALAFCAYTLRGHASDASLIRASVWSRARDRCIRKRYRILFWTVGYLLAYQRIFEYGNPSCSHPHTTALRAVVFPASSPLACKHRNFSLFLLFERTFKWRSLRIHQHDYYAIDVASCHYRCTDCLHGYLTGNKSDAVQWNATKRYNNRF